MKIHSLFLSCAAVVLAGCGGGGGGASIGTNPPPPSAVVISNANAMTLAGITTDAVFSMNDLGGLTTVSGVTASAGASVSKPGVLQDASTMAIGALDGGSRMQAPVGPVVRACLVSGTTTTTGDLADQTAVTAGDFFEIVSDNCNDGDGTVTDGLVRLDIDSFAGDLLLGQFLMGITLTLTDFMVSEGTEFSRATGGVSATLDTRTPPVSSVSISGTSFAVDDTNGSQTLSNFSSTVTLDEGMFPIAFTTDATGTLSSDRFTGTLTYDTPVPFQSIGDAYPHAGEALVTGANNSTLRLIALDDVNVRIEADYDGDGAVDETTDTTWAELSST